MIPRPQEEPEPIDLLEVAGGAAMARYAAPAAGSSAVLLLIFLLRPPPPEPLGALTSPRRVESCELVVIRS